MYKKEEQINRKNNFNITFKILFSCVVLLGIVACKKELVLIDSNKTSYVIVIPAQPSAVESKAASELQTYLYKMSDVMIPIVDDREKNLRNEISVGNTNRINHSRIGIDGEELEDDGFLIKTEDKKVYVTGGKRNGVLYGVHELLERYLGCRKYSPTVEHVPRKNKITLPRKINDLQVPVIKSRNMSYTGARDKAFFEWLRLTHTPTGAADWGRWGLWVHTFGVLVPENVFYESHPEYYTMNEKGERVPSQLCLTNPEVLEVLCSELEKRINAKPEAIYWSVSQNDNYNYCKCENCMKVMEEEGSPSGLIIRFVNEVASRFPEKIISTLVYQYSRKAPKYAKPAKNVNLMFCSIECNRSKPIRDDESSASFREDMENWAKLSDNIILWDYMVQFSNLYTPFPNFRVLQPNMQYFVSNNVSALYSQGNPQPTGDMWQLRAYVAAKLLWNPDCDLDYIIDDFLNGFYGKAGKHIKEYLTLLHDNLEKSGEELSIFGNALTPINGYLSPENLDAYERVFDKAKEEVSDNPQLLERVREAELSILFARLEQANLMPVGEHGFFNRVESGKLVLRQEYTNLLERFIEGLKKNNAGMLCEWMTTVDEYSKEMKELPNQFSRFLSPGNKALGKPASLGSPFKPESLSLPFAEYKALQEVSVTNGVLGARNYDSNWIGFRHDNFEVVINLQEVTEVREINIRFMQSILDRIFLPHGITVETSVDNHAYHYAGQTKHAMDKEKNFMTKVYTSSFPPRKARYLKIKTDVVPTCPLWHRDAGCDVFTLFDEISIY